LTISVRINGPRKYSPIWLKIKTSGFCKVHCPREDTITVVQGVKKEKVKDKNRPKGKTLQIKVTEVGVEFTLATDTSINNL